MFALVHNGKNQNNNTKNYNYNVVIQSDNINDCKLDVADIYWQWTVVFCFQMCN